MKKLNKEHQENKLFQSLKVFENEKINQAVDSLYQLLKNNFGSIGDKVCVCGSVAKMMHGTLPKNYEPKDVDLLIVDPYFYRFLQRNINQLNVEFTIEEQRIILFYPNIIIELWQHNSAEKQKRTSGKFKNLIHYAYL